MSLITIYMQDFAWPDCKSLQDEVHHGKKRPTKGFVANPVEVKCVNDQCQCILKGNVTKRTDGSKGLEEEDEEEADWSRIGPMGPLLDAKLFPAKGSPAEMLAAMTATAKDGLISTYQKDYSNAETYHQPMISNNVRAEYPNPRAASNICHPPIRVFDRSCTKNYIPKVVDESMYKLEGGSGGGPSITPYGKTEYQDIVGRLGARIIAEKLIKPIKKKNFWK